MAMDDDETLVQGRDRLGTSILDMLDRGSTSPVRPEARREAGGKPAVATPPVSGPEAFDPASTDYKAFGWADNATLPAVRFILKNGEEWAGCYAHLDTHHPGGCRFIPSAPGRSGNIIRLRFAGQSVVVVVTIEGRKLHRGWELLLCHQTPWVHEYPADIDDLPLGETVVKSISIVTEK